MENTVRHLIEATIPVMDYLSKIPEPFKSKFTDRLASYAVKENIVEELKRYAEKVVIIVFSAEWCKDCIANVPVLALLSQKAELNVRVFGGIKKDPLNPREKWRIPPSSPEIKDFGVEKLPHIIIFDLNGVEIGKIIENPSAGRVLEEEILNFVKEYYA